MYFAPQLGRHAATAPAPPGDTPPLHEHHQGTRRRCAVAIDFWRPHSLSHAACWLNSDTRVPERSHSVEDLDHADADLPAHVELPLPPLDEPFPHLDGSGIHLVPPSASAFSTSCDGVGQRPHLCRLGSGLRCRDKPLGGGGAGRSHWVVMSDGNEETGG